MNEFDFIRRYLTRHAAPDAELVLGVGDDAAILRPQAGYDWHISSDMLLAGRHFFADVAPQDLAHKVLAVNLSDMAAMGAQPRYALLSAALPNLDETWLDAFCSAFFALADQYGVRLIGGDTTRGDLTFNITIIGQTPHGQALRRDAAQVGDDVWVSGSLGLAAAALAQHLGEIRLPEPLFNVCEARRLRPEPRVALAQALLGIAHAAQDISDGLLQDAAHIARASACGMDIFAEKIPSPPELRTFAAYNDWVLAGGDDYELLFTAAPAAAEQVLNAARACNTAVTRIGRVTEGTACRAWHADGTEIILTRQGFDHFASP
ncbi:MAG: thiamine-phosphate kinase [Neisseria sp.]|nr:thiamine-phosphate kinase [Neisseria sp.]